MKLKYFKYHFWLFFTALKDSVFLTVAAMVGMQIRGGVWVLLWTIPINSHSGFSISNAQLCCLHGKEHFFILGNNKFHITNSDDIRVKSKFNS